MCRSIRNTQNSSLCSRAARTVTCFKNSVLRCVSFRSSIPDCETCRRSGVYCVQSSNSVATDRSGKSDDAGWKSYPRACSGKYSAGTPCRSWNRPRPVELISSWPDKNTVISASSTFTCVPVHVLAAVRALARANAYPQPLLDGPIKGLDLERAELHDHEGVLARHRASNSRLRGPLQL